VWHVTVWRDQKVRHIQLHVAKALGKVVAAYGEGADAASGIDVLARVRDEVMPDVAMYRSQLLNLFPDCGDPAVLRGCPGARVAPQAVPTWPSGRLPHAAQLFSVVLVLSRASAQLAAYLEPREHGVMSPPSHMWGAIQDFARQRRSTGCLVRGRSDACAPGTPGSVTGRPAPRVTRRGAWGRAVSAGTTDGYQGVRRLAHAGPRDVKLTGCVTRWRSAAATVRRGS
jgi:hypothetical protein